MLGDVVEAVLEHVPDLLFLHADLNYDKSVLLESYSIRSCSCPPSTCS